MQLPPVQFELPQSESKPEPHLPRLIWAWVILIVLFGLIVPTSLNANDSAPSPLQDKPKLEQKDLDLKMSMKTLQKSAGADDASVKNPLFEDEIDQLLEKSKTESKAQKLRIVLRLEDGEKPFLDDIRNLAKSKNLEDQAFAKLFGEKKPDKNESMALLKQIDGNEFSEKIAVVQVKESFGDKQIRAKTFDSESAVRMMIFSALGFGGFLAGGALLAFYLIQRQNGKLTPKGIPMANISWAKADRLVFVGVVLVLTFFMAGTLVHKYIGSNLKFELFAFIPVYMIIPLFLTRPVFGWRIMPEEFGLTLKGLKGNAIWAVSAFLANIPILFVIVGITAVLSKFVPGGVHPMGEELANHPKAVDVVVLALMACVLAPIWEEILFRGLLFPAFNKALGKPIYGALLSSFLFASIHPQGMLGIIPLMGIALMLCSVSYQTKSLTANIILHGLHNGAMLIVALLVGPLLS